MAVTLVSSPIKTITPPALPSFISYTASTTQLLYTFNEDNLVGKDAYVLECYIVELDLTLYAIPKPNGDIKIDVGYPIRLGMSDQVEYLLFTIEYTPVWRGGTEVGGTTDPVLAIASRRQIMANNGSNLYDFVAKDSDGLGKILSVFDEPKLWYGWMKIVAWINQDLAVQYDMLQTYQDINKNDIGFNNQTKIITPNVIDYWILTEPTALPIAEYLKFTVQSTLHVVSSKWYKIETACDNPVMIQWVNYLGGWDSYLFQIEQAVTQQAGEGLNFEIPVVSDIETINRTSGRVVVEEVQFMTLKTDHLNQNELRGLADIKASNDVRVWLDQTGGEWVGVTVSSGYETSFTTGKNGYEFSLNIKFPVNFDFFKGKKY